MKHNFDFICFDLETGGLDFLTNPVAEIGLIRLNYQLEEVERFHTIIAPHDKGNWGKTDKIRLENPWGVYTPQALQTNKLTMTDIQNGMKSDLVVKELIALFNRSKKETSKAPVLVGHNIKKFDIPYLTNFFQRHKENLEKYYEKDYYIDTLWLARTKYEESDNYQLGTSCSNENISLSSQSAHTAMGDIEANVELLKVYINGLRGVGQTNTSTKEKRFREDFKF